MAKSRIPAYLKANVGALVTLTFKPNVEEGPVTGRIVDVFHKRVSLQSGAAYPLHLIESARVLPEPAQDNKAGTK